MERIKISKGHDFSALKAQYKQRIDEQAEKQRAKYLTPILGQEYVYAAKLKEAQTFLNGQNRDMIDFPFLSAEAVITGWTSKMVAQNIVDRSLETNRRVAAIEAVRQSFKSRIDACENKIRLLDEILNELTWPMDPRDIHNTEE